MRSIPVILVMLFSLFATNRVFPQLQDSDAHTRQMMMWQAIKRSLQKPDGKDYFEHNLKDTLIPGGTDGLRSLIGTVVASEPTMHPTELVLAMSDTHTPEVTLRLIGGHGQPMAWSSPISPGSEVAYEGVGTEFTQEPFMLTFEVSLQRARPRRRGHATFTVLKTGPTRSR